MCAREVTEKMLGGFGLRTPRLSEPRESPPCKASPNFKLASNTPASDGGIGRLLVLLG
jgi:hypothetical protein